MRIHFFSSINKEKPALVMQNGLIVYGENKLVNFSSQKQGKIEEVAMTKKFLEYLK